MALVVYCVTPPVEQFTNDIFHFMQNNGDNNKWISENDACIA